MRRTRGTAVCRAAPAAIAAAAAVLLASCSAVETRSAERFTQTGELIALSGGHGGAANACFGCHGLDGRGNAAGAPRLAGLDLGYLVAQLEAYADGRRQQPEMQWIAERLSQEDRQSVAAYYADMGYMPTAGPRAAGESALYRRGDPARGLPSCASCHGESGEGIGPGNPPLAGQPAAYLAEQVERWRHGKRRNDPAGVMMRISRLLTPREAEALARYAAGLPGVPSRPESPAAFRAAHRADPRSGA